ncbi:MAG: hypothetical protein WBZ11_04385 [Candidatus Sulfotelmatobacter sp.]
MKANRWENSHQIDAQKIPWATAIRQSGRRQPIRPIAHDVTAVTDIQPMRT